MSTGTPVIRTSGSEFLGPDGKPLLLRGVCLGGWLNMENFITGYSANETLMRREVRRAIGDDRAAHFFQRLLTRFFDEPDAAFLGEAGLNLARIAVGYHHFEDDARPFEIKADGFCHLDRAIEALTRRASIRSSTCTPCPAHRTNTGTPTIPPTSRRSGNTGISRTGSCTCGKPSPTTTEVIPGWPDTTC